MIFKITFFLSFIIDIRAFCTKKIFLDVISYLYSEVYRFTSVE